MLRFFRIIALLEGVSFLLIFAVSMPLKYIWQIPEPNFYIGIIHGLLFMLYIVIAIVLRSDMKWNFMTTFWVMLASLLPFGTFVLDHKILKKMAAEKVA